MLGSAVFVLLSWFLFFFVNPFFLFRSKLLIILFLFLQSFCFIVNRLTSEPFFFIISWCIFSATFFGKSVFGWVRFQLLVLFMPLFRNSFCSSSWWKGLVWIEFLSNVSCSRSLPGGNQVDGLPPRLSLRHGWALNVCCKRTGPKRKFWVHF